MSQEKGIGLSQIVLMTLKNVQANTVSKLENRLSIYFCSNYPKSINQVNA